MGVFYEKKESNWWFILGFICPIAGLIIYIMLKDSNKSRAVKAGCGALSMVIALAFIGMLVGLYYINYDSSFYGVVDSTPSSVFLK